MRANSIAEAGAQRSEQMGASVRGAHIVSHQGGYAIRMESPVEDKRSYTIGYVSLETGLTPHVIRIWEKRYGAVTPERTGSSRRLYSRKDIDHLILLKNARARGQRIGTAVKLDRNDLARISRHEKPAIEPAGFIPEAPESFEDSSAWTDACMQAVIRLDATALEDGLRRAGVHLTRSSLMSGVMAPLMQRVGDGWADGTLRMIHEHLASNVLKGLLWEMMRSASPRSHAPRLVVTTPSGQLCEIGAMMAAVTATDSGWNALYLGPSLPAGEIAAAALHERAESVALSISCPMAAGVFESELSSLTQVLGKDVFLLVGGRAAPAYRRAVASAGARCCESLHDFTRLLGQTGLRQA